MKQHHLVAIIAVSIITSFAVIGHTTQARAEETRLSVDKRVYPYVIKDYAADVNHALTTRTVVSQYTNPEYVLAENAIAVDPVDTVKSIGGAVYAMGGVIEINRAPVIHIVDGKRKKDVRSWAKTVNELIAEQQLPEIANQDTVTPAQTQAVVHDMTITIVRVQETDVVQTQVIPFTTIEKEDPNVYRGETKVTQEGKNGSKAITHHLRREDGVTVSDKVIKTEVIVTMTPKTIVKGTKLKIGRSINGGATRYSENWSKVYDAATHVFPRGTKLRVTNLTTGKSIFVTTDDYMENANAAHTAIDLDINLFKALGRGTGDSDGNLKNVLIEEVLN